MISYHELMAKHAQAAMRIAQDLIRLSPGDRLPPVGEYARQLGVGRGTVQSALQLLKDQGAVALVPRGHMGTFVESIDPVALWELTGLGTITGVMPLPYSTRYKGLATGLYRAFQESNIPLVLAHMRGARRRLMALNSKRYEFALVSRFTYDVISAEVDYLELAVAFGPRTSVREHVVLVRVPDSGAGDGAPGIRDGMRVGIDSESIDISRLTLRECQGRAVDLVEVPYLQFPGQLQQGTIDAAIWDPEQGIPGLETSLRVVPLRGDDHGPVPDTGEAVLVVHRDNQVMKAILREKVRVETVRATQERVLAGVELPEF